MPTPRKPDHQVRGRNPREATDEVPDEKPEVVIPETPETWHFNMRQWFNSLKRSAVSRFYDEDDWAYAYEVADEMSRYLVPQLIGQTKDGEPIFHELPVPAGVGANFNKAVMQLLACEAGRRQARIQLWRADHDATKGGLDNVEWIGEYRRRYKHPLSAS